MRRIFSYLGRGKLSIFVFHRSPVAFDSLIPHEPDLAQFSLLMDFIVRNFSVIPLADAVKALQGNSLPSRSACITFDDGYRDWFDGVVPLLKRRQIPATFLITTSQLDGQPLWYDRILQCIRFFEGNELDLSRLGLSVIPLGSVSERASLIEQLEKYCKYKTLAERNQILSELEELTGIPPGPIPHLTADDVRSLYSSGFEIGAHTINHPILRMCSLKEARDEIGGAKEVLEQIVGARISSFAYPNGKIARDILPEHIGIVRQCGYSSAVTTEHGTANSGTSLLQLPRFTPWGKTPLRIAWQLARNLNNRPEYLSEQP